MMTNDAKINFTLRMNQSISSKIAEEAKKLGLTKNAYIVMVLHKEFLKTQVELSS